MMKSALVVLAALALVAAQQPTTPPAKPDAGQQQPPQQQPQQPLKEGEQQQQMHHKGEPLWKLNEDQLRFRPSEPIRGSVLTSTKLVMDAALAREPGTASVHFAPFTTIIYKTSLPNGGVFKGWMGLIDFMGRSKLTFNLKNFSYSIPFVDEARGVSILKIKYSGNFVRTGKALESSSTVYLKWQFGKLRKCYIVDDDFEAVLKAYQTTAEQVVSEFYNSLFECGDCAAKFLADDVKNVFRSYPRSGGNKFSYEGVGEFKKRVGSPEANLMLAQIQGIKYLFGSDNQVVALIRLGAGSPATKIAGAMGGRGAGLDVGRLSGASVTDAASIQDLAAVSLIRVEGGKIKSINTQLNQPLMPWHLKQLGMFVEKKKVEIATIERNKEALKPAEQKK